MEAVLAKGGELTGPAISEELRRVDLLLPLGRVRFNERGDPTAYEQVVVQVQQGEIKAVFPPQRATGRLVYPLPPLSPR